MNHELTRGTWNGLWTGSQTDSRTGDLQVGLQFVCKLRNKW